MRSPISLELFINEKYVSECIHRLLIFLRRGFLINKRNQQLFNLKQWWPRALVKIIFGKVVNSFRIIPLLEDLENSYLVYLFLKKTVKQCKSKMILKKWKRRFLSSNIFISFFLKKAIWASPYIYRLIWFRLKITLIFFFEPNFTVFFVSIISINTKAELEYL